MNHFIIPEDKDENWKNSEVMKNFLEEYQKVQADVASGKIISEAEEVYEVTDENLEEDLGIVDLELQQTKAYLEDTVNRINKIAVESEKYGNEKATYRIELAGKVIESLLDKLNSGEL